jgi:hypothetical protein
MREPLKATLSAFADALERRTQLNVRTHIPCRVLSYDANKQRVEIELGTVEVAKNQDGSETVAAPIVLPSVPILFPGTADSYINFPIEAGDTGMALICDRSIAAWRTDGKAHPPSLPGLHNLADAVFVPGLRHDGSPLPKATMGGMVLESASIQLGAGAVSPAVLGTAMQTLWDAMVVYINAHTHSVPGVTVGPTAVTSGPPASPLVSSMAPTLSDKVFVE